MISRPRFWLYIFGPYLVGLAAGATSPSDFVRFDSILFGIYFLFPANLLVYGVNDIFDFGTDSVNPKKAGYESLVGPERRRTLLISIALLNLPFLIAAVVLASAALPSLAAFLFFSVLYSAPPVRAKTVPVLDSAFNVLYVFPGAFAYQVLTGSFPPAWTMIAAGLWTAAMHAYSAIPDIAADRKVGLNTIATLLRTKGTLLFCLAAYLASAALAWNYLGLVAVILGAVYSGVVAVSFVTDVFRVYRYFPVINAATGFALFWSVVYR